MSKKSANKRPIIQFLDDEPISDVANNVTNNITNNITTNISVNNPIQPNTTNDKSNNKSKDKSKNKTEQKYIDSTFILYNIDMMNLDRLYVSRDISNRYIKDHDTINNQASKNNSLDITQTSIAKKSNTINGLSSSIEKTSILHQEHKKDANITSLIQLGISNIQHNPSETIYWGDHYKIQLYYSNKEELHLLTPNTNIHCTHCHGQPPTGALMLAVPYRYVPTVYCDHTYAPECINIIKSIDVDVVTERISKKEKGSSRSSRVDQKKIPKSTIFRRELSEKEFNRINTNSNNKIKKQDYFECAKPVCSFSCMITKGKELARNDPRFRNVLTHICHLYQIIFGKLPQNIIPAPTIDVLSEYGGMLSRDDFIKNFHYVYLENCNQFRLQEILHPANEIFSHVLED